MKNKDKIIQINIIILKWIMKRLILEVNLQLNNLLSLIQPCANSNNIERWCSRDWVANKPSPHHLHHKILISMWKIQEKVFNIYNIKFSIPQLKATETRVHSGIQTIFLRGNFHFLKFLLFIRNQDMLNSSSLENS